MNILQGGSITSVPGFRAAGVHCGLKKTEASDLALLVSDRPCRAAAVFTQNKVAAAPVICDRRLLKRHNTVAQALVINSGCANACTGIRGLQDAEATAAQAAAALGLRPEAVWVMSTGVIGQPLPMDKLTAGIGLAAGRLSPTGGHEAALAIMTTDTRPKEAAVQVEVNGKVCTVAGMCKGAGMMHPNMATLLSLIVTDALVAPDVLQAGNAEIRSVKGSGYVSFLEGLTYVTTALAKMIAADGEGASKFVEITVRGARTFPEAKQVAMAIAHSPLVKTALYGQDANWGRVLCAAGYSGADIDPDRLALWLGDLQLVKNGEPYDVDEERALQILSQKEIKLVLDLGLGDFEATVWTCDFTHEYVNINAHYRT